MHDLRHHGLVYYALKRGGTIHPITLPKELTGETGIMNPSIFIHEGRILLNVRHVNYTLYHSEGKKFPHLWGPLQYIHPENDVTLTTHNIMCELDANMNILSAGRIKMNLDTGEPTWNFIGLEDGRLFSWEDRLFLCGVRRDAYDDKGTGRMEMCEIEFIDNEWQEVGRHPIPAPGDDATFCEKNWMPILEKPFHFVKWSHPTEVVKANLKDNTSTQTHISETSIRLGRDLRGGSQILRWNDKWFGVTHELDPLSHPELNLKDAYYFSRFVIWDDDWNIIEVSEAFSFMGARIEFTTGLAEWKEFFLMTFGYADAAAYTAKVPKKLIEKMLTKVSYE